MLQFSERVTWWRQGKKGLGKFSINSGLLGSSSSESVLELKPLYNKKTREDPKLKSTYKSKIELFIRSTTIVRFAKYYIHAKGKISCKRQISSLVFNRMVKG